MPLELDSYDVSILKSLLKDGRKSFREISRETGITTPTVKARFNRLANVGFIKSVSPILNLDKLEKDIIKPELQQNTDTDYKLIENEKEDNKKKEYSNYQQQKYKQQQNPKFKVRKGMKIKLDCEFCKGPISGRLHVFRFADFERFFCCTGCISGYKQKYAGRIESIKRKFEGRE
jgi:DNA-binding Lrp family transcriptional regulator